MSIVARDDSEIVVTVPATVPAGAHPVQIIEDVVFGVPPGSPAQPHPGFHSNVVAMLVIPKIIGINPPAAGAGANVTITVSPAVQATQEVEVLLGDRVLPAVLTPAGSPSSPTVQFQRVRP